MSEAGAEDRGSELGRRLDVPVRLAISQRSTSEGVLGQQLKQARVIPASNLQAAAQMLQRREIDAFATNKAILFELPDRLPGARVLDGRWGLEQLAIAVPKGRDVGRDVLQRFAADVKADGTLQRAVERAGLRGVAALP